MDALYKKIDSTDLGNTPVSKFMRAQVISVLSSFSIKKTIETLKNHNIGNAPVVDNDGKLIGIISEHDLLLQAASKNISEKIEYTKNVIYIDPSLSLKETLILFYKKKLKNIPVVNDKKVVGMVYRIQVLDLLSKDKVMN